jgi:hypothetical protein
MHRKKITCAWIVFGLLGCAKPVPAPEKTIEALYAPYLSHAADKGESTWEKAGAYSKNFKAVIDRGFEYSDLLNEPVIDYDPVANAQDYSLHNLHVEVDQPANAGKARVIARFENYDQQVTVGYDMVFEDGAWKIDGIRSGDQDLRKSIDEAIKPVGDPKAMKAPVEKIYAKYAEAGEPPPLSQWAPLTGDLRDQLAKVEKKSALKNFDPVRAGGAGVPSDVQLEAVSGGVIARFKIDGQSRVVVYDVVGTQGVWRIDDIHFPGNPPWDLVQKLEEAEIKK